MDIVSHGLWGAITFGRRTRRSCWLAFVIGLAPDLLSFGILSLASMLGLAEPPDFSHGTPPESSIPQYVHHLYNVTHSLVVFLIVFLLVWVLVKRPVWELSAWGLHVLMDIPSHSFAFFPTPFLWPLSDWKFNGWQWTAPHVFIPNAMLLILLYVWYFAQQTRQRREQTAFKVSQGER
ncbi:MAG: conserved rane protein of unknown function [Nitrospira sp.]|nr:conserved rane protein of unknown function [Nitrospira sp.]